MMKFRTLDDIDTKNKRVVMRADFNVPILNGKVVDDFRISSALPTIKELLKNNCAITIIAHRGRPKGEDKSLTLKPVAERLSELLKLSVKFLTLANALEGSSTQKNGEITLVENIRFYKEEDKNDVEFAKKLNRLGDIYVSDAFADSHREHASVSALPRLMPSCAGRLMEKEVSMLSDAFKNPKKPLVALIGGVKVSTKIDLIKSLLKSCDILAIGGAMANTFLVANGYEVGKSIYEEEMLDTADEILRESHYSGSEVILPNDGVISKSLTSERDISVVDDLIQVGKSDYIVDIGPTTLKSLETAIKMAGTIIWNGPFGITEVDEFAKGTEGIAKLIAASSASRIVGGGDTLVTVFKLKLEDKFDLVSTGGGAMLDFIAGKPMPGLEALQN